MVSYDYNHSVEKTNRFLLLLLLLFVHRSLIFKQLANKSRHFTHYHGREIDVQPKIHPLIDV